MVSVGCHGGIIVLDSVFHRGLRPCQTTRRGKVADYLFQAKSSKVRVPHHMHAVGDECYSTQTLVMLCMRGGPKKELLCFGEVQLRVRICRPLRLVGIAARAAELPRLYERRNSQKAWPRRPDHVEPYFYVPASGAEAPPTRAGLDTCTHIFPSIR